MVLLVAGAAAAQTGQDQTSRQLYDAGQWSVAQFEFDRMKPKDPILGLELLNMEEFRAGTDEYGRRLWNNALDILYEVDPRLLPKELRDEYHFKRGHALFAVGRTSEGGGGDKASRRELMQVLPDSDWAPHAAYYIGYLDYESGDYESAKELFNSIAESPDYKEIIPYYLLQIEFLEGNFEYVTQRAPELIPKAAIARRKELSKMTAQAWFRLDNYDEALTHIENYQAMGGEMERDEFYLAGYSLYHEERLAEAAQQLARAIGPDDALSQNVSYHLADIYLRLGDVAKARQSFSIAATSDFDPVITQDALFNYAKLLFETDGGLFNETVNVLTRYIETYPTAPNIPIARELLFAAYYNAHDYKTAYDAITQYDPGERNVGTALQKITYYRALELYVDGDANGAMQFLNTSLEHRYAARYTALASFWQGEILYKAGNYESAIPKYETCLRFSPDGGNLMARYDLGYANFNLQRWDAAKGWFEGFLSRYRVRDALRADALNRLGDINRAQRSYWQAIENYDGSAAISAENSDAYYYSIYQRAMALGFAERTDRKIESLQAIIDTNRGPYVEVATFEMGNTFITLERYAEGAQTLVNFLHDYPESQYYTQSLMRLGLAYLNMGMRQESLKYYEMVVTRAPYSPEAQSATNLIHDIYLEADDADGFFAWARATGAPIDTGEMQREEFAFNSLQRAYLTPGGDRTKVEAMLKEYIGRYPHGENIATVLTYLSDTYYNEGRFVEAAETYSRLAASSTDPVTQSKARENFELSSRKAEFTRAGELRNEQRMEEAVTIYKRLAADTRTAEGAESAFRVIQYLYDTSDYDSAQQAVFAFSDAGTSHGYWLGSAFLILGDIYVKNGDSFQARATYQSIVDGYLPVNDGIVAAAKEKIAKL